MTPWLRFKQPARNMHVGLEYFLKDSRRSVNRLISSLSWIRCVYIVLYPQKIKYLTVGSSRGRNCQVVIKQFIIFTIIFDLEFNRLTVISRLPQLKWLQLLMICTLQETAISSDNFPLGILSHFQNLVCIDKRHVLRSGFTNVIPLTQGIQYSWEDLWNQSRIFLNYKRPYFFPQR